MKALLTVEGLHVHLGDERHPAVRGVGFSLREGERAAILGPSGCGKTTTLRALAGFEEASEGRVVFDGRDLASPGRHVPPHQRGIGMVFQDFALFPHLSVTENVAFGLERTAKPARHTRAEALLSLVGLEGLYHRLPGQLSGGQQQRVALARALAPSPKLLLLDEPFSSLDAGLRAATRAHTEQVLEQVGAAALLVTHDQTEALSFAHHLIVMNEGRIEQLGAPETLYRAPRNAFVACFLGAANLLEAEASGERASSPWGSLTLQGPAQGKVLLCVRPEDVRVHADPGSRDVGAEVASREFRGASCILELRRDDRTLMAVTPGAASWRVGERVAVGLPAPAAVLEGGSSPLRTARAPGGATGG